MSGLIGHTLGALGSTASWAIVNEESLKHQESYAPALNWIRVTCIVQAREVVLRELGEDFVVSSRLARPFPATLPYLSIVTCLRDKEEVKIETHPKNQDQLNALKIT